MDATLVPFAIRVSDAEIIDVGEADRGQEFRCPSCQMPLVAKRGPIKVWHFAHASRGSFRAAQQQCLHSFFVSVRMMARQIVGREVLIRVPGLDYVARGVDARGRFLVLNRKVADERIVHLEDVDVEVSFAGAIVDFLGNVGGFRLGFYLTHPGRSEPRLEADDPNVGMVAIALDALPELFAAQRKSGKSYREFLKVFIQESVEGKAWLHHPRLASVSAHAESVLAELLEQTRNRSAASSVARHELESIPVPAAPTRIAVGYRCVICGSRWLHRDSADMCPKCQTHLYSKVED